MTYLNCLLGPLLLLNFGAYALFHPLTLPGKANLAARIVNKDIGMDTHYGVRHQLMIRLADELKSGTNR